MPGIISEKVPGIWECVRQYIEVIEISTPLTNMRYIGTIGGAMYGFASYPHYNMIWRFPNTTSIKNLYFVGAWTQPGGGFEPSILSGKFIGGKVWKVFRKLTTI